MSNVGNGDGKSIGTRIRELRGDMSLNQLAKKSGISKGYLWTLEDGRTATRPSAETVYAVAEALGVTMADLFGRRLTVEAEPDIPDSLRSFARDHDLPEADVKMLASIRFRGEQPNTPERWEFIYNAIRGSSHLDDEAYYGE